MATKYTVNSNTVIYLPMDNESWFTNKASTWITFTNTWAVIKNWYWYFWWMSKTNYLSSSNYTTSSAFTILVWTYVPNKEENKWVMYLWSKSHQLDAYMDMRYNAYTFRYASSEWTSWTSSSIGLDWISLWKWYLVCYVYNWWEYSYYVRWWATKSISVSKYAAWYNKPNILIWQWWSSSWDNNNDLYLSEFIEEKRARTESEIDTYYNNTKDLYTSSPIVPTRIIKKFYHMWVEYKIKGGKPTPSYKTYTVSYTEAATPVFTYSDDATNMTAWSAEWDEIFGYYPCLLNTSWVETAKLNPNDYTKTIDWASANITSGDNVMVMFPRRGYKISKNWNTVTVSITTNPNAEWYCYDAFRRGSTQKDKFYLWAYHWSLSWSVLKSWSGKGIAVNHNITNWRTYAQANGTWYEQWAFNQLTYLQCLWLLKYKNLNSQATLWQWYTWWSAATTTGATNTNWLNYWSASSTTHVKLFWIEDFWWNTRDWIDGIYCDSSYNIWTWTDNFTSTAMTTNYTNQWSGWISSNIWWYMIAVQGTSTTWFIAKTVWWSDSTYYSDYGYLYAGCFPRFGGSWATGATAGVFYLYVSCSASEAISAIGSRLMFL